MSGTAAAIVRRWPRAIAAIAFGGVTAAVVHFAWVPEARVSGAVPWWTLVAAVTHGVAGAIVGLRLVDGRTRDAFDASLAGVVASAAAVTVTAVLLSVWVTLTNASVTVGTLLAAIPMVVFFAFVTIGWALLLSSAVTASLLYLTSSL